MDLRDSGRASLRASRVLMPARTEPRPPPKDTFPDSQDHARSFSGPGAHSERKIDGGRNGIVTRHDRWGGLIGCPKRRRVREANPRFRTYYRAAHPARFAR